jgi:SAM-dependent methyltransferase
VAPSQVTGIDLGKSQIERAAREAAEQGISNVQFLEASCYSLPFADEAFDCVFSHALFEHLSEPRRAVAECWRVLRPGGRVGVCSPDWGGFIVAPPSPELASAIEAYVGLQTANGGDVGVGRKLGAYLSAAGFQEIRMQARYECYGDRLFIGEYLARQLEQNDHVRHANVLRSWAESPHGLFAQCWVSAAGRK